MKKFTLIDKAFLLKKTLLFGTLDLDILLAIADKLQEITFVDEETIFGVGEEAFRMFFIVQGQVDICDANHQHVTIIDRDEFFGDESMFNEKPRAYYAISKGHTSLLALSRTNLLTIISECPSVAMGFLQAYTSTTSFRPRKNGL
ncbi:MAG: cyclic nucleotide-binding domain-containing protein [Parachlamydiaceae bacterium]|nr:cyclic nucleotide-binding domain-containing protein [Parachlamydiaceae bacterium]